MKKNILFSCVAGIGLLGISAISYGEGVSSETTAVTERDFEKMIGIFFDADDVKVEKKNKNFNVTVQLEDEEKPENAMIQTVTFMPDGTFGKYAQYRVDLSAQQALQEILDELNGKVTIGSYRDIAKVVPEKQIVSYRKTEIKDFNVNIQQEQGISTPFAHITTGDVSFADVSVDLLSRFVSDNQMDVVSSANVSDFKISVDNIVISIPEIASNLMLQKAPITADEVQKIFGAEDVVSSFSVPTIQVTSGGDNTLPMLTAKLDGKFTYGGGKMNVSYAITNIQTVFPFPPQFIPESIELNIGLSDLDQSVMSRLSQDMTKEEISKIFGELVKTTNVKVNKIEVKNKLAGVLFQGYRLLDKDDISAFNGVLTITNLDTLSPEPKVDEAACSRAKADLTQNPQDKFYQRMAAMECTPRGGMLDPIREYLKPENRTVQADGTTQDIIRVRFKHNQLFLNNKKVYNQQANEVLEAINIIRIEGMARGESVDDSVYKRPAGVSKIEADAAGNVTVYFGKGQEELIKKIKEISGEKITCSGNVCNLRN